LNLARSEALGKLWQLGSMVQQRDKGYQEKFSKKVGFHEILKGRHSLPVADNEASYLLRDQTNSAF
jgi:hypothetical protein